ncbi:hypothetical protein LCGC14_1477770 [marine sediment metagenome]|uniref:Uncharacterized protein n=1 Tax=marine sediment metagenome TaxID=412755 RepID=A0A0F9LQW2_9ZZZZ
MKKFILVLLLFSLMLLPCFGQEAIFGTVSAPLDTSRITNTGALTSRIITYNAKPEGVGTLFMAGDTVSGAPIGVVGQYQLYYGLNQHGQAMYGQWRTLTDSVLVKADITTSGTYNTTNVTGRETNLADDNYWSLSTGIRFRFTGVGTQVTLLSGWFDYF